MWILAWIAFAEAAETSSVDWAAHAGLQGAFGMPLHGLVGLREPAAAISLPAEVCLGVTIAPGMLFRAHMGAGLLLNGAYLYSTGEPNLVGFPIHVDLLASAGVRRSGVGVGVLGGYQFPSRPTARGFLGWAQPGGSLTVELRGGVNLPTARPVEPVLQLLIGVHGPNGGSDAGTARR